MSRYLKLLKFLPGALVHGSRTTKKREFSFSSSYLQKSPERKAPHSKKLELQTEQVKATDRDLVEFLTREILEERRIQGQTEPPISVNDFSILYRGSEVELTKELNNECITVFFNVSKSVQRNGDDEKAPLRSKPKFEVLIRHGQTLLSIYCKFQSTAFESSEDMASHYPYTVPITKQQAVDIASKVYQIHEVSLFEHAWNERAYTIEASMIDMSLYQLLMEMLVEKGIDKKFAIKISDLATLHEHNSYIGFLENLSKFAVGLPQPIKIEE
ncbi:complement component 1 Q subcomponent-binding protein, mitochondrial-like [Scaptodrosophila lebanonensis]|uniref:Complement component 1 Q subcomponent-binding protein, mitochondrial-like n=1 Tax=Drosophila lebanonensis TaxID=7225 RepID=A0A6J2TUS4_DROLE|nr:complement component 1 Q subcomponent-binding protein, mitochondrial-like [Scaptodrosophila lebanonensis]